MVCDKCGYKDVKEVRKKSFHFCRICSVFAPNDEKDLQRFVETKIPWKSLESYRKYGCLPGSKQKDGMNIKAKSGKIVSRPPRGYSVTGGVLQPNKDAIIIYRIFRGYLKSKLSKSKFATKNHISLNALKNILRNRTYIGEVKFEGKYYPSGHKPLVDQETFYAVQRKLKNKLI